MNWYEALILGIVQGLTEFLPVSSSGHLELGNVLLGTDLEQNLTFTVVVHGATVLSTLIVFRKDLLRLLRGLFEFRWNTETQYIFFILLSMIPVAITGFFLKDQVESLFTGNLLLVGLMLLFTALLLVLSTLLEKEGGKINSLKALLVGIAQAIAVIPGISRSGATIAVGLMAGVSREEVTRFSFLMVLIPVIGVNLIDWLSGDFTSGGTLEMKTLVLGFLGAFTAGLLACRWMIRLVKKGKLVYFALYCLLIGAAAIIFSLV